MPHFYFHVHDGTSSPDRTGSDVVDFDDARCQALRMAGTLLQEQGLGHSPVSPLCVEIADGNGAVVLSIQVGLVYRSSPERDLGDRLSSHLT